MYKKYILYIHVKYTVCVIFIFVKYMFCIDIYIYICACVKYIQVIYIYIHTRVEYMLYGMYTYIYITCYIYHHIPNQQDPCFFCQVCLQTSGLPTVLVENPGFPFKTRGFQQNRVRPSGNAAQTAKYSHLTRISRICYTFSGIFFMFDADP